MSESEAVAPELLWASAGPAAGALAEHAWAGHAAGIYKRQGKGQPPRLLTGNAARRRFFNSSHVRNEHLYGSGLGGRRRLLVSLQRSRSHLHIAVDGGRGSKAVPAGLSSPRMQDRRLEEKPLTQSLISTLLVS